MTDLRESVAIAIQTATMTKPYSHEMAADLALRAVADAGFVIVPRETVEGLIGHAEWVAAEFDIHWAHLAKARAALGAALKEMGQG